MIAGILITLCLVAVIYVIYREMNSRLHSDSISDDKDSTLLDSRTDSIIDILEGSEQLKMLQEGDLEFVCVVIHRDVYQCSFSDGKLLATRMPQLSEMAHGSYQKALDTADYMNRRTQFN